MFSMLRLQEPLPKFRFRAPQVAEIVVQEGDCQAQRRYQSPEDPEVSCHKEFPVLSIEVEELGAENCLLVLLGPSVHERGTIHIPL